MKVEYKADDKVKYEDVEEKDQPKFTNFEELKVRVELLQEVVDELTEILRANNLVRNKEIEAPYFDEDKVYNRLDGED